MFFVKSNINYMDSKVKHTKQCINYKMRKTLTIELKIAVNFVH